jgi:uronate dehydrogenase
MPDQPLLLTGAAGTLGRWLRPGLLESHGRLRISDIKDPGPAADGEEVVIADLGDRDAVDRLVAGTRAIVHFGGIAFEKSFDEILHSNIIGTYNVYEAARKHGVKRVVFASSNHAIGFHTRDQKLDAAAVTRPDTYYGVSKTFGENLASLYVDKYGLEIACLRIGSALPEPREPRHLSTWLSYPDLLQMVEACLTAPKLTFAILYGASANDRTWWDNSLHADLGFRPRDNAEAHAAKLLPGGDQRDPEDPAVKYQGGTFVSKGLVKR